MYSLLCQEGQLTETNNIVSFSFLNPSFYFAKDFQFPSQKPFVDRQKNKYGGGCISSMISKELREKVIAGYREGQAKAHVAKELDISEASVYRIIAETEKVDGDKKNISENAAASADSLLSSTQEHLSKSKDNVMIAVETITTAIDDAFLGGWTRMELAKQGLFHKDKTSEIVDAILSHSLVGLHVCCNRCHSNVVIKIAKNDYELFRQKCLLSFVCRQCKRISPHVYDEEQ